MAASSALLPTLFQPLRAEGYSHVGSNPRSQCAAGAPASPFFGTKLSYAPDVKVLASSCFTLKALATVTLEKASERYTLPSWSQFELGKYPVFWETANGRPPASGELLTLYFNPFASNLTINESYGVGFNGGFNSPIMCGGSPRRMSKKERGPQCESFYTIKINVPAYATSIIFSFTDGSNWSGPYTIDLEIPAKWRNLPSSFFNEALERELKEDGACDAAIFPDSVFVEDRCLMPKAEEEAPSCEIDLPIGCMDPDSPNYDPLAIVDDGSCPIN